MCFYSPRMSCIMSQKTLKPTKDKSSVFFFRKRYFVLALTSLFYFALWVDRRTHLIQSPATCVTAEFAQFTGTTTNENDINIYINVYRYINTTAFLYKKSEKMRTKFSILT